MKDASKLMWTRIYLYQVQILVFPMAPNWASC